MSFDEHHPKPRAFPSASRAEHSNAAPLPGEGVEPELEALCSDLLRVTPEFAISEFRIFPGKQLTLEERFVEQRWHRPYASALMEKDPANLAWVIAVAEEAILERLGEAALGQVSDEERGDLRRATDVLSELRKTGLTG